jgi:hypothetical protein
MHGTDKLGTNEGPFRDACGVVTDDLLIIYETVVNFGVERR